MKMKKQYSYQELSAFCLQISLLLETAVPLDEGLMIMSDDAADEEEKEMLKYMSEGVELGDPFAKVIEEAGVFPAYMVRMVKLGQTTGNLDYIMKELSEYYKKENIILRNIKNAITYPLIMVTMLLVVLFALFTKVMPIFDGVYEQLGAQMPPIAKTAISFGGIFSGAALLIFVVLAVVIFAMFIASKNKIGNKFTKRIIDFIKCKSKIAKVVACRRFTSVLSMTLASGLEMEKGMEIAKELVENSNVEKKIVLCSQALEDGMNYYQSLKNMDLFSGFHIQMIKVGNRSGKLDGIMKEISEDYEQQADTEIDNFIARFEPTVVAFLAIAVGLILMSVMLPLIGVMSSIG